MKKAKDKQEKEKKNAPIVHDAVRRGSITEVKRLLRRPENVSITNAQQQTPVHTASIEGQLQVLTYLLDKKKADVNARDRDGWTPLHCACHSGNLDIVDLLISHGAHVCVETANGSMPMDYFVRIPSQTLRPALFERLFRTMIRKGVDINKQNQQGETPLHMAAFRGKEKSVGLLLWNQANTNLRNKYGETALHLATRAGYTTVVKQLLDAKSDWKIRGDNGTCLDVAIETRIPEIINLYREYLGEATVANAIKEAEQGSKEADALARSPSSSSDVLQSQDSSSKSYDTSSYDHSSSQSSTFDPTSSSSNNNNNTNINNTTTTHHHHPHYPSSTNPSITINASNNNINNLATNNNNNNIHNSLPYSNNNTSIGGSGSSIGGSIGSGIGSSIAGVNSNNSNNSNNNGGGTGTGSVILPPLPTSPPTTPKPDHLTSPPPIFTSPFASSSYNQLSGSNSYSQNYSVGNSWQPWLGSPSSLPVRAGGGGVGYSNLVDHLSGGGGGGGSGGPSLSYTNKSHSLDYNSSNVIKQHAVDMLSPVNSPRILSPHSSTSNSTSNSINSLANSLNMANLSLNNSGNNHLSHHHHLNLNLSGNNNNLNNNSSSNNNNSTGSMYSINTGGNNSNNGGSSIGSHNNNNNNNMNMNMNSALVPQNLSSSSNNHNNNNVGNHSPLHSLSERSSLARPERRKASSSSKGSLISTPERQIRVPPKTIGKYAVGECLGSGAFGFVYKAFHQETGEIVAIKQVSLAGVSPDGLTGIMAELHLLKRLENKYITKYLGFEKDDQYLNIVLEFVEGGSLQAILKKFGGTKEPLCARFVAQTLIGLNYLHRRAVVHRDIKCANILVTKNSQIKLADFGIAVVPEGQDSPEARLETLRSVDQYKDKAVSTDAVGSPYWMAPEVVKLQGASSNSDIWSLGCTVIELIDGKPPYSELTPMSALFAMVKDPHPPFPSTPISPELEDFLKQCFHKEPKNRPTAEELLRHKWIINNCGDLTHELASKTFECAPVTPSVNDPTLTKLLTTVKEYISWLHAALHKKEKTSLRIKEVLWTEVKKLHPYRDYEEARVLAKECMQLIRRCEELFPNDCPPLSDYDRNDPFYSC